MVQLQNAKQETMKTEPNSQTVKDQVSPYDTNKFICL